MLNIFKREISQSLHDPRRFFLIFCAGIMYLLLFKTLYQPNIVTNIPTVIFDDDNSKISREFVNDIDAADSFNVVDYVTSEEDMIALLQTKKALAAVEIPKHFNRDVKTGKTSTILLIVNGTNLINTSTATSAMQDISEAFSNKLAVQRTSLRTGIDERRLERIIAPVQCNLRILGNPTQGYLKFLVLGLALVAFQQGIILATGSAIVYEYKHLCELPAQKLIFAKSIYYWGLSTASFGVLQYMIDSVGEVKLLAPTAQILLLGGIFCLAVTGFGMLIASLFTDEIRFLRAAIMIPVPAFILSGYTWPAEAMPHTLQWIASFIPLTWFENTVRDLFLLGHSPRYFTSIVALLIIAVVCFVSATFIFRRTIQRLVPLSSREGASSSMTTSGSETDSDSISSTGEGSGIS